MSSTSGVGHLQESALKRKERLKQLRDAKRAKTDGDNKDGDAELPK